MVSPVNIIVQVDGTAHRVAEREVNSIPVRTLKLRDRSAVCIIFKMYRIWDQSAYDLQVDIADLENMGAYQPAVFPIHNTRQ